MALTPPQSKEDWLYATVHNIATQQEVLMATLSELKQSVAQGRADLAAIRTDQGAQTAALSGLASAVDTLITMVNDLKVNLSAEETALVNEAMADVSALLADAAQVRVGETGQTVNIAALSSRAQQASEGSPPTP